MVVCIEDGSLLCSCSSSVQSFFTCKNTKSISIEQQRTVKTGSFRQIMIPYSFGIGTETFKLDKNLFAWAFGDAVSLKGGNSNHL